MYIYICMYIIWNSGNFIWSYTDLKGSSCSLSNPLQSITSSFKFILPQQCLFRQAPELVKKFPNVTPIVSLLLVLFSPTSRHSRNISYLLLFYLRHFNNFQSVFYSKNFWNPFLYFRISFYQICFFSFSTVLFFKNSS